MRIFKSAAFGAVVGCIGVIFLAWIAVELYEFVTTQRHIGIIVFIGALPGAIVGGVFKSMDGKGNRHET